MKKNPHTERLNFALSKHLKESIEIAAHSQLMSVSDYIRGLVYHDLSENSVLTEDGCFYIAKHKLGEVGIINIKDGTFSSSGDKRNEA